MLIYPHQIHFANRSKSYVIAIMAPPSLEALSVFPTWNGLILISMLNSIQDQTQTVFSKSGKMVRLWSINSISSSAQMKISVYPVLCLVPSLAVQHATMRRLSIPRHISEILNLVLAILQILLEVMLLLHCMSLHYHIASLYWWLFIRFSYRIVNKLSLSLSIKYKTKNKQMSK